MMKGHCHDIIITVIIVVMHDITRMHTHTNTRTNTLGRKLPAIILAKPAQYSIVSTHPSTSNFASHNGFPVSCTSATAIASMFSYINK